VSTVVNLVSILIQDHHSAGFLTTSNNGFNPPLDPFYISNIPSAYPDANMRCANAIFSVFSVE
jgi:hypothetical protein